VDEANAKVDLRTALAPLYEAPTDAFVRVTVPPLAYYAVDGDGDPNVAPAYREAVESLYATAYAIKFACKAEGRDFVVAPLEGLWSGRTLRASSPGASTNGTGR